MNDTHPEIERVLNSRYAALSPERRLEMGYSMFDFSKELIEASIRNENPSISNQELKKQIFLRLYKDDFEPHLLKKILAHLEQL